MPERLVDDSVKKAAPGAVRTGGRDHDELRASEIRIGFYSAREPVSGKTGHHLVEEDNVVRLSAMPSAFQFSDRIVAVFTGFSLHAQAAELPRDYLEVHLDIIDNERAHALQICRQIIAVGEYTVHTRQRDLKEESRAVSGLAGNSDLSPHEFHELLGNCETKPGAAIAARDRTVRLAEFLEKARTNILRHADSSVLDLEAKLGDAVWGSVGREQNFDGNATLVREFDSVSDKIEQNLAQSVRIASECGAGFGIDKDSQIDAFLICTRSEQPDNTLHHLHQIEIDGLELDFSGFELGYVQDVVDDRKKRFAGVAHGVGVTVLLVRQRRIEQQPVHAQDAVHRRADFVTHRGQKFAFDFVRAFRRVARDREILGLPRETRSAFAQLLLGLAAPLVVKQKGTEDEGRERAGNRGGKRGGERGMQPLLVPKVSQVPKRSKCSENR